MKRNAGDNFPLASDKEILLIDSPKSELKGPWFVVHKDMAKRWAIVAMHWNGNPRLGIRWFLRKQGTPSVRGFATWFVIPKELSIAVLKGLPISPDLYEKTNNFLSGKIDTDKLKQEKQ